MPTRPHDRRVGMGPPFMCFLASCWIGLNVLLGHVATTCTMGDDGSRIGAAIVSGPAALLVWALQARMIFRGLTPDGAYAAFVLLALANLIWLPTAIFGFEDVTNLLFHGGALCGPDYAAYAPELSDWRYWLSRSLVAFYFALGPLLTLALSIALVVRNKPLEEH